MNLWMKLKRDKWGLLLKWMCCWIKLKVGWKSLILVWFLVYCRSKWTPSSWASDLHPISDVGARKGVSYQPLLDEEKTNRNGTRPLFDGETNQNLVPGKSLSYSCDQNVKNPSNSHSEKRKKVNSFHFISDSFILPHRHQRHLFWD